MDDVGLALAAWLDHRPRDPSPFRFKVSDLSERGAPDEDTVRWLGEMMVRAKTDPAVLERMSEVVGWPDASSRLRRSRRSGVRRGDFGEALACDLLEAFDDLRVPVRKLRYQIDPEQTLHGTDIVGFSVNDDGFIEDLHFVETKLRTIRDLAAGVAAHEQLAIDRTDGYADTLMYLGDRLAEIDPALFEAFVAYLEERTRPERGSHGIVLVWDVATWDEDVLSRVEEVEQLLDPLLVRVVQAAKLAPLIEQVYDAIGADVIDNGS